MQVAQSLDKVVKSFTPADADPDSVIDRVLVIRSDRRKVEQEQIPEFFTPITGRLKMRGKITQYYCVSLSAGC